MTSPTDPPKKPLTERISERISFGKADPLQDPEERFTRNVTIAFVAIIVLAAAVIVVGLAYGFYDQNLKPVANVDGTSVGRGEYNDRVDLETLRLERAESNVRTGLADGSVNEDLASRRLTSISSALAEVPSTALDTLVDLLFKEKLAAGEGVMLTPEELAAAVAADGTSNEARRISVLGFTSPDGSAQALLDADNAKAALDAGTSFTDVAAEFLPGISATDLDRGYFEKADIPDPVLAEAIFALDEGGTTDVITTEGAPLIAMVTGIVAPKADPGLQPAAEEAIGEAAYRRNVELEALATKLQDKITADAVGQEYEQVKLSEILISGDTTIDPADDEGSIRASHILYAPGEVGAAPAEDDPAWAEAQQEAERAALQLRLVADPEARAEAFATRARLQSDDTSSGANGGDLGFFDRAMMVPEFADAVFDAPDPAYGDIIGPVRSEFGWHVIMYDDRKAPLADRLATVEAALAEDGADFASVAEQYSDGPEALQGGETGWHVVDDLDELSAIALAATEVGSTTSPVDGDLGYYIYLKEDEAVQPLQPEAATRVAASAFDDWYQELRFSAEDEGRISIDESFLNG